MHAPAFRTLIRERCPGALAFYKRHIRRHVARHDSHYAIAAWVTEGLALRARVGLGDVCFNGDGVWFVDPRGLQWRFMPGIWGSSLGAATGFIHEPAELESVCTYLDSSSVVVDVGANVGMFALPVAQATGARVIAIEPVSSTFGLLTDNVRRNGAEDTVRLVRSAVGERAGEVVITNDAQSANHVLKSDDGDRAGEERVPVTTLDALLTGEIRIDLIKVDVEGLELDVMRGCLEILQRHAPAVLLEIEARWTWRYGYEPAELFALMDEAGYSYQPLGPSGARPPTTIAEDLRRANNFLFSTPRLAQHAEP